MKIERIKAILQMAPTLATHYAHGTYLYKHDNGQALCWMVYSNEKKEWVQNQNIYRFDEFRNLEDLQMIDDWFGAGM